MNSINTARDFFINQQGLSPDQADMIIGQGLQAYNEQTQPKNMMQMASGGRIGYGFGSFVKASGVAEPVSGGETSGGGGFGMGLMGRLIQQNPQMFRQIQASSRADFIDRNLNGIDDRQEVASGGRIGYQMGGSPVGVQAMPMDYGQSLQVNNQGQGQSPLMSQAPNYSSATSITTNPLLNYGQTSLTNGGGIPLTMRGGGIARLGYESGGVTMPSQGSELNQLQGMDQQQALEIIIKILIENGIPPEQAQQLALQIIQIFAQGGAPAVEAFANQLEQQETQAMASGGIAGYAQRQGYGWGSFVKGIVGGAASAVKGVANAVKSVAKSSIGRAALTIAAATFLGPGAFGIQGLGLSGLSLGLATAAANAGLQKLGGGKFSLLEAGLSGLSAGLGTPGTPESTAANITTDGVNAATTNAAYNAAGVGNPNVAYFSPTELTSAPTSLTGEIGTGYAAAKPNLPYQLQGTGTGSVIDAKAITSDYSYPGTLDKIKTSASNFGTDMLNKAQTGIQNLYQDPLGTITKLAGSAYDTVKENIVPLTIGATAGYAFGTPQQKDESDEDFAKRQKEEANLDLTQLGRNLKITNPYFYQRYGAVNPFATTAANGGIMGYAGGGSMIPPARQIEGGVIELDARKSGGYIPYGKKERVDDVPAMLAKDEFVFTSRAVKGAGGGDARLGAKKMYALMKQLEAKGARA